MSLYAPPIVVDDHNPHACSDKSHANCAFVKSWWKINRALKKGRNITRNGQTAIIHREGQ